MKLHNNPLVSLILKKAERIYFEGGDWKGFIIEALERLELDQVPHEQALDPSTKPSTTKKLAFSKGLN